MMRLKTYLTAALLLLTAWLMNGCADTLPAAETKAATKPQITVLYDAFGKDAAMKKDWAIRRSLK